MKAFCFFILLFLLYNCTPPSITYNRIIENNSNYDIWLSNSNFSTGCIQDSVLVPSNTQYILDFSLDRNASVNDYTDCPMVCIDTVNTRISDHDSLNLAFPLESTNTNWQYRVIQSGESGECECRLTITDADIN